MPGTSALTTGRMLNRQRMRNKPITTLTALINHITPVSSHCRLYVDGLIWALGMKFAIDQINNSTSLLPGVKLGYDMYDTCFEPAMALYPSLLFLTQNSTTGIGVLCNYSDYQPRVTAVIGPYKSDLCLLTAKLFSFFWIPQVKKCPGGERIPLLGRRRVWINNAVDAIGL